MIRGLFNRFSGLGPEDQKVVRVADVHEHQETSMVGAERLEEQNALLREQLKLLEKSIEVSQRLSMTVEALRLAAEVPVRAQINSALGNKQLSMLETVERIANDRLSFARYGDGEIRLMTREDFNIRFQKNSPGLKRDLRLVLEREKKDLLLGMPHRFVNAMWSGLFAESWDYISAAIENKAILGDSHVSRPLFFEFYQKAAVDAWRKVWQGRRAIVVAGKDSRFEMIDELFDNLAGYEKIVAPAKNAYVELDRIVNSVLKIARRDDIVLAALGPAGTILSARLSEQGIQTIDIGHIAASYRNVFLGDAFPEDLPVSQLPQA